MRALVTGASGLIGRRVCAELVARGHSVVASFRSGKLDLPVVELRACELADTEAVRRLVHETSAEVVINAAAMSQVESCEKNPDGAFADNALAPHHLAVACRERGAHLIQLSTDYVFDGESGPYSEEAIPHPISVYGQTKLMGELAVRIASPRWAIARTAVVYGFPAARYANFGSWLVEMLQRGEPVQLFEDQTISPSLAANVAEMICDLAESRAPGIWNLCGAEVMDRVRFGRALCKTFGFNPALIVPVRLSELPSSGRRPLRAGLRSDKAQQRLKTQPLGLEASLELFRNEAAQ